VRDHALFTRKEGRIEVDNARDGVERERALLTFCKRSMSEGACCRRRSPSRNNTIEDDEP
jgi:hypothetical protein